MFTNNFNEQNSPDETVSCEFNLFAPPTLSAFAVCFPSRFGFGSEFAAGSAFARAAFVLFGRSRVLDNKGIGLYNPCPAVMATVQI